MGSGNDVKHCHISQRQCALDLLKCTALLPRGTGQCNCRNTLTASLPGGSGRWNSLYAPPHCLEAVGSVTPAKHSHTAGGQWAVDLLQRTALLPRGSGQCNFCSALPHGLGAMGNGTPVMHCLTDWCSGQRGCCNALPSCLGAAGGAVHVILCLIARGLWAVQSPKYIASLPGGSGQYHSCIALPHFFGAVRSGIPAMHRHTPWGRSALQLLQCSATPTGGGGKWNSCNVRAHHLGGQGVLPRRRSLPKKRSSCKAMPRCRVVVGSATPAVYCLTARGQRAVELLQWTASLLLGSGQWSSCFALPH